MRESSEADQVRNEVHEAIAEMLRGRLGRREVRDVQVRSGFDHEGDEALFVDVYFNLTEAVDPRMFFRLTTALRDRLTELGEFRFPHIRYHFDEAQTVAGWK